MRYFLTIYAFDDVQLGVPAMDNASGAREEQKINNVDSSSRGNSSDCFASDLERVFRLLADARAVFTSEDDPQNRARVNMEMGSLSLLRKEGGRKANLEAAVAYFTDALKVYRPNRVPWDGRDLSVGSAKLFGFSTTSLMSVQRNNLYIIIIYV